VWFEGERLLQDAIFIHDGLPTGCDDKETSRAKSFIRTFRRATTLANDVGSIIHVVWN
jgi:hypothetical protein